MKKYVISREVIEAKYSNNFDRLKDNFHKELNKERNQDVIAQFLTQEEAENAFEKIKIENPIQEPDRIKTFALPVCHITVFELAEVECDEDGCEIEYDSWMDYNTLEG